MSIATHIDLDAPRYRDATAQILSRHDALQPEANITSAVRDFLIATGLVHSEWLRDTALVSLEGILPDRDSIAEHFGPDSPAYQHDIETLRTLYQRERRGGDHPGQAGALV